MKKTFFIVCLLSVVMFSNICYADTYQVDIVGINKKVIIEKVANDMVSTNGFMISNINDY